MSTIHLVPTYITNKYEVHEWRNAAAVIKESASNEWNEIIQTLDNFKLARSEILKAGGRKSLIASRIDTAFYTLGWEEKSFQTSIQVDGINTPSPTHKIDCFKNNIGVEVEWNNKDPFFDRDLNNFRLLFDLRTIEAGVIITRSDELQEIFNALGKGDSYGQSTTHMGKLIPKIEGGGGGGCPILVFGIQKKLYDPTM